jgi:hypothetical protein
MLVAESFCQKEDDIAQKLEAKREGSSCAALPHLTRWQTTPHAARFQWQ